MTIATSNPAFEPGSPVGLAHAFRAHANPPDNVKGGQNRLPALHLINCLLSIFVMSRYRRADTTDATYFFTVVTYRRRPILCDDPVRAALRDAVKTVQSRHPFTIDAWFLLLDHLHAIWTLPPGDADYAMRWRTIGCAKR